MAPNPLDGRASQLKALLIKTLNAVDPEMASEVIPADKEAQLDIVIQGVVDAWDILAAKPV